MILHSNPVMETYLKLLLVYRAIPKERPRRTFMDVAGFPRRENVCSNILAFYLNPSEEHGLGDLVLSSFLGMTGTYGQDLPLLDRVTVRREVWTTAGKRMDVVVEHQEFAIGIENKIDHWLANDLVEYSREIGRLATGKRHAIKVVLGVRPVREALPEGFNAHTYAGLWQRVRVRLGERIATADPRWITHLIDFMENTERLTPSPMDLKPTDRFYIDHDEDIRRLIADHNDFQNRLAWRVTLLKEQMGELPLSQWLRRPLWVHAGRCLVVDFSMPGVEQAALDLWLHSSGWQLELFGRDSVSNSTALRIAAATLPASTPLTDNKRYVLNRWPIDAELPEVSAGVVGWLESLMERASKEIPATTLSADSIPSTPISS